MNLFDLVRTQTKLSQGRHNQEMTQGLVTGVQESLYKVTAGGFTFLCQSGLEDTLNIGDRVWIISGRGTARIVGLMGKDAAV
jgi:hypothetical protein